ncbi:ATP-binding protein [Jatrophihabitans telluris]|uniref:ATP-binding protein n=1 Tax=Jatrophihabitans telluris TaxID=2038343 RepID=A0ABY4QW03_9ACTN|nr:ATP-binding protein [Jatrophihabitans telluris]UQX87307.1 ATP-binding protein [Jatrophihabitans telluris]
MRWIDDMVAAGFRHGVVVFPGFEVTSATGADGVHLIIFGAPGRSGEDLQQLLFGACGFGGDHPLFNPSQPTEPAPSPYTVPQILDALPDDYLVIAPHAFNDNGLASRNTVSGSLRWKAMHHDRLVAVDVGDIDEALSDATSWKARFVRRELSDFPCLPGLAFVASSDAYALDEIGTRFTWIRMESPTLEAMRQSFLDHDARIVCDWDPRYRGTDLTPNTVTHAWVRRVALAGATTTPNDLEVDLDPRLTVVIGGRGSGKSTVVAALRALYGDLESLPSQARTEARQFETAVFPNATVRSAHRLAYSEEEQAATWTATDGSTTLRLGDRRTPTDFKVRVVSQKELFERSASSSDNPHATSQNILALVDDEIFSGTAGARSASTYDVEVDQLRTTWTAASRLHQNERAAVARAAQVRDSVDELQRQVAAFDDEANRARRTNNDRLLDESAQLDAAIASTESSIQGLRDDIANRFSATFVEVAPGDDQDDRAGPVRELDQLRQALRASVTAAADAATQEISRLSTRRMASAWQAQVSAAQVDSEAYAAELAALGLDPDAYGQVREQLREQTEQLADLTRRAEGLTDLEASETAAWTALSELYERRHERRQALLNGVAEQSGILRFTLDRNADTTSWVRAVRHLLNLRADGFIEDVPELAEWLWLDATQRDARARMWGDACVSGDFAAISRVARLRGPWSARLRELDPIVRTRLAAEVPDEVVTMEFRRAATGRQVGEQWEALTAGSPGQRSAAMLSFVLHHGVEPLVLDQPEDDLDTEWITQLVVKQLRTSRWTRQLVVVTHNANIPVNADAERVVVLENIGDGVQIRTSTDADGVIHPHLGAIEDDLVRKDIQKIMEGGVDAFVRRERRYNNELNGYRAAMQMARDR